MPRREQGGPRVEGNPYWSAEQQVGGYRGQEYQPWENEREWDTPQYGGGLAGPSSDFATWPGRSHEQGAEAGEPSFRGVGPRGYQRSDQRLLEDVNERLTDDPGLDATDISVEVSEGKVTLQGRVGERWMKYLAEDDAASCFGVKDIDNRLRVGSPYAQ